MNVSVQMRFPEGGHYIRSYVEALINANLGKFEAWHKFRIDAILGQSRSRSEVRRPIFDCEILLTGSHLLKPLIVKKSDSDFYQAVKMSLKAAEKILHRTSRIQINERKHRKKSSANATIVSVRF